jgi:hypothetical protein
VGLTTPPWKRLLSRNLKKQQPDLELTEASEEGQGPCWAVEPMKVMMIVYGGANIVSVSKCSAGCQRDAAECGHRSCYYDNTSISVFNTDINN